jgi:branched-chain amino acid transport system permease protein
MMQERTLKKPRSWRIAIGIALYAVVACVPPFIHETFFIHVVNMILLGSALALSWGMLALTGYVSFAHNVFIGIGAYSSAYLVMKINLPFWLGFLSAGLMAGLFALVLGLIILRLKGIFFVLSTFCFAEIMLRVFRIAVPITGGLNGIRDIPPPVLPFFGAIESDAQFYLLFLVFATLVALFTVRLYRSNTGREFRAIGEDMFATESMGINTFRQKVIAFIISSVIAGFVGSLHAHYFFYVSDTTFEITKAVEVVIYNVVGGVGTIVGPILGSAVMIPIPEFLRGFVAYQIALYGLILILILRFFPKGIWGTAKERIYSRLAPKKSSDLRQLQLCCPDLGVYSTGFFIKEDGSEGKTILECSELRKFFGGLAALEDVSFSVRKGEIFGIVGPNGAGKTTLYNTITGVLPPELGKVIFEGKDVTGLKPHRINRLGVGRVFQTGVLYNEADVEENIARALLAKAECNGVKDLFGLEKKKHQWIAEQTQEVLKLCSLEPVSKELAKNLPFGFQRLLGLAMALAPKPKLLLLDEPVSSMNAAERDVIASIYRELQKHGLTMVVVEHNVSFVMQLCTRIMVLNYGVKIAEGSPEEIRKNPKVIESFLGE